MVKARRQPRSSSERSMRTTVASYLHMLAPHSTRVALVVAHPGHV